MPEPAAAGVTVKGNAPDAAPPGLSTETWAVPGAAMSAVGYGGSQLGGADKGCRAGCAIPLHDRPRNEIAAIDGEGEGGPSRSRAAWSERVKCRSRRRRRRWTVKGNAPDAAPPGLITETWAVPRPRCRPPLWRRSAGWH